MKPLSPWWQPSTKPPILPLPPPELEDPWADRPKSHWQALWLIGPLVVVCLIAWSFGNILQRNVASDPKPKAAPVTLPLPADPTPRPNSGPEAETRVPFEVTPSGSLYVVGKINSSFYVQFAIDSGADLVSIPPETYLALVRNGTITRADMLPDQNFVLADGSISRSKVFMLRSLKIGDLAISNVKAALGGSGMSEGLLGQTFLKRFKSWSIDNHRREIVLTYFYGKGS